MKNIKIILLAVGIIFTACAFSGFTPAISNNDNPTVYVCGKSTIYHDADFHAALKRCKSGISKVKEKRLLPPVNGNVGAGISRE